MLRFNGSAVTEQSRPACQWQSIDALPRPGGITMDTAGVERTTSTRSAGPTSSGRRPERNRRHRCERRPRSTLGGVAATASPIASSSTAQTADDTIHVAGATGVSVTVGGACDDPAPGTQTTPDVAGLAGDDSISATRPRGPGDRPYPRGRRRRRLVAAAGGSSRWSAVTGTTGGRKGGETTSLHGAGDDNFVWIRRRQRRRRGQDGLDTMIFNGADGASRSNCRRMAAVSSSSAPGHRHDGHRRCGADRLQRARRRRPVAVNDLTGTDVPS